MRHITQATYKSTELGQIQVTLNALSSKKKRRSDKLEAVKNKIQIAKDKAIDGQLSSTDKIKLQRLELDYKHAQADFSSLQDEIKHLKMVQLQKRQEKKKKKDEIFNTEDEEMDGNMYIENYCGLPADGKDTADAERVVDFPNM